MTVMDAAENGRVQRMRNLVDRENLAVAYALHRLLLARALRMDARHVPLRRDSLGCPRVGEGPVSSHPIHTSLSHAGDWLAFSITCAGPTGVDIEPRTRIHLLPEIADSLCHPSEARAMGGLPPDQLGPALLALWVRKEAALKAVGVGLSREMRGFEAPEGEVRVGEGGDKIFLRMVDAGPACLAAVAGPCGVAAESLRLSPANA